MARKVNYSDERFNPDEYYEVSHFDENYNCTHEYFRLSEIPEMTEEIIICIRQINSEEHYNKNVNERYLSDPRYQAASAHQDADAIEIMDSFCYRAGIGSAEVRPRAKNNFVDKVHSLLPLLTENQQRLYELLKEGYSLQEIAKMEGTTKDAIASRKRKLHTRLYKLYAELFGDN